ncbi:two-component regulator propeller domain-containing protein [Massilia sp. CFBP9012]|uniref:sensor histidine kinase n=1 Tax=Massilia sp. CFBP9012 TaxID=3096531 RepID=UPI002A6A4B81|nr:two-component regulator propeller domain-containing protein [Massilia sp. CFBP9012]MDY0977480.1 two-component regulator propeller domain-containing protein [Massilia sp. CFBP9012]
MLLVLSCAWAPAALALDPSIALDGYRHERWGELEGAPRYVDALARSQDGWLWVGSRYAGLLRFDGLRFLPFETGDGSRLQNNNISALRPGPDGELWIGHGSGGLSVLRKGRYRHLLTPEQSGSVFAISLGADGAPWIAGWRGLFRVEGDRVVRIGPELGYDGARAEYVLADGAGRVWATDGAALYLREAGATRFHRLRPVRGDSMLLEARDGSVWLVLGKEFEQVAPPSPRRLPFQPGSANTYQSLFDRDGNVWSGNCPVGICVLRPADWQRGARFTPVGAAERLDQAWQMTSLSVLALMEDGDGSIWVGTPSGLERLRDHAVHMVPELLDRGVSHPARDPDGGIVAARVQRLDDTAGLVRIENGKVRDLPDPIATHVLDRAPDGTLVLGGRHGIERHGRTGVERIPLPPAVSAAADSIRPRRLTAGNDEIWLWTGRMGAWHYRNGAWTRPPLKEDHPQQVAFDAAGRSYLGLPGNRLRIVDGAVREYSAADGLEIGKFSLIVPGQPLLVSGEDGMQVLAGARFRRLAAALPDGIGAASGIVTDTAGVRWINTERGIYRVTPEDWTRSMNDPGIALRGRLFDAADGYLGGGVSGLQSRTAAMASDGTLWFAGERGLAWIDPRRIAPNPATPKVEVLGLSSGARRYPADADVTLDQGTETVQIDYTAPSLRMPQKVSFHFRLAGSKEWEDAGARRSAFFQRLPPGVHTFEVMAVNESGVAGPATALVLHIPARYYQTWWFLAACVLALLSMIALAYRRRTRRLARRIEDELLTRLRERESIARSLHDTFLQSVQGMLLRMHSVVARLPADSRERAEFERVMEDAERVLEEGRDEVQGLRRGFADADAFWQGLLRDVELIVPGGGKRLALSAPPGAVERLPVRLRGDVHAIVREALVNALRHTPGPVRLEADPGQRGLTLTVSDAGADGRAADKPGHFGLQGMRERAAQIGARLRIDSGAAGTRVTLAIPVEPDQAVQSRPALSTSIEETP